MNTQTKKTVTELKGSWFLTSTGTQFYPLNPRAEDIIIADIAHSLANICRFGGHCNPFYSVAQHSVHVSKLVSPQHAMAALLHDATEAYIGDMVRPLKINIPQFNEIEEKLWKVIAGKFDLPEDMDPEIKHADNVALMTERRDLVTWTAHKWGVEGDPDEEVIIPLMPGQAKALFLHRFTTLLRARTFPGVVV